MSHYSFICHITPLYVTLLLHLSHDSFICPIAPLCVTWLLYMSHYSFICHITPLYVTLLIICHITPLYVTLLLYITPLYVTLLLHMSQYSFVYHMTPSYVTWLLCMSHDPCISIHAFSNCHPLLMWHDSSLFDITHTPRAEIRGTQLKGCIRVRTHRMSAFTLSKSVVPHLCDRTHPHLTWLTRLE